MIGISALLSTSAILQFHCLQVLSFQLLQSYVTLPDQDVIGISVDQLTHGTALVATIARPVLLLLMVQTLRCCHSSVTIAWHIMIHMWSRQGDQV